MANHKSAEKRARQAKKRNLINRMRKSQIHTLTKRLKEALSKNDEKSAEKALSAVTSVLARAARKGTLHWRTAARKTSRLAKLVSAAKQKTA